MTELPPAVLSELSAEILNPPGYSIMMQDAFLHTVQADGADLQFGRIIRRDPLSDAIRNNVPELSFGPEITGDGAVIAYGVDEGITGYFEQEYGSPSLFFEPLDSFDGFQGFSPKTVLRWPEEIRNPERLEFLKEAFNIDDPSAVCILGADIPGRIETSNAVRDPLVQTFIMDAVLALEGFSNASTAIYNTVVDPENDLMVCAFDDGGDGRFYASQRIINVNYSNSPNFEVPFLETPEDMFWDTYQFALITGYEESGHAHIELERTHSLQEQVVYRSQDEIFFGLAEEAFIKLNMAVDAVRNVYELGDNGLYEAMARQPNGEAEMVEYLWAQVRSGDGYEALEDPDNLFHAFTLFFRNEISMAQYYPYYNTPEFTGLLERNTSRLEMPVDRIEDAFGTLIGDTDGPNFLAGRFESLTDITALIPEGSDMRNWIEGVSIEPQAECSGDEPSPDC